MSSTNPQLDRRHFLAASAAAGAALAAGHLRAAPLKTKLHKALIGNPVESQLAAMKAAGFEGIECRAWSASPAEAAKGRIVAEKLGMRIHAVMRAWTNFNVSSKFDSDVASVETALKAAEGYGVAGNLADGANIAGFLKVAKAMMAQGLV